MTSIIVPGEGIAEFLPLGISLYDTVSKLRSSDYKMSIAYSGKKYLESPILVTLPTLGIRLTFLSSQGQELQLIEILNFDMLELLYNGQKLNEILFFEVPEEGLENPKRNQVQKQVVPPCLKVIYNKIFGPTYPGVLNLEKKTYMLSYPGISLNFEIKLKELLAKLASISDSNQVLSKLANWDVAPDIPCLSMAIYNGKDYANFLKELKAKTLSRAAAASSVEKISVTLSTGEIQISFPTVAGVVKAPQTLKIGVSTQQDVLRILGPPDAYFNKFDSRLLIHKHLKSETTTPSEKAGFVYKFHNYFRLGMDLLYNLNPNMTKGGVLEKVVLHNGGIAESLDFMQWNKCNWEIRWNTTSKSQVDSSMYFHEFGNAFIQEISTHKTDPVLLNRNESEITKDEDLEILHVAENGKELAHTLSSESIGSKPSNEFKTWGQSKLYGYDHCIWEVLESNNCVSNVTIY